MTRCSECGGVLVVVDGHGTHPACSVDGCDLPIRSGCLCNAHGLRKRRTGTVGTKPVGDRSRPKSDPVARFWAKVDKTETCWLWTAAKSDTGYGSFRNDSVTYNAHRLAYELLRGQVPSGLVLDHLCRVRHCVNPDHLEPVTERVNIVDRSMSPTAVSTRTNRCKRGHEFTPENTRWQNAEHTKKTCRTCSVMRERLRRAA